MSAPVMHPGGSTGQDLTCPIKSSLNVSRPGRQASQMRHHAPTCGGRRGDIWAEATAQGAHLSPPSAEPPPRSAIAATLRAVRPAHTGGSRSVRSAGLPRRTGICHKAISAFLEAHAVIASVRWSSSQACPAVLASGNQRIWLDGYYGGERRYPPSRAATWGQDAHIGSVWRAGTGTDGDLSAAIGITPAFPPTGRSW
jgi:hypothetical protein